MTHDIDPHIDGWSLPTCRAPHEDYREHCTYPTGHGPIELDDGYTFAHGDPVLGSYWNLG